MGDYVYTIGDYQSGEDCDPSIFKCGDEYEYIKEEEGAEEEEGGEDSAGPVPHGNTDCQKEATNGQEYVGKVSKSEKNRTCKKWTGTKQEGRPGIGDHNYCRNPDNESRFGGGCLVLCGEPRRAGRKKQRWKMGTL